MLKNIWFVSKNKSTVASYELAVAKIMNKGNNIQFIQI